MNATEFHNTRKFQPTPNGRIAYVERGAGPAALLLHGYPMNGFQWRGVIDDLGAARRCIAPDLMGLGYSEIAAGEDVSFVAQARMLASFLDQLGIEAVDLVGSDTGGGISQTFAALYPARIRSLTLLNCEVHDTWPNEMSKRFFELVSSRAIVQWFKLMLQDQSVAHAQLNGIYEDVAAVATPETVRLYLEPLVANELRCDQACRFADLETNRPQLISSASQLRKLEVPAQVIWGEADTVFDMKPSLDWLRANLGGIRRVITVPRAKLYFQEEHPRLVSTLLREFWGVSDSSHAAECSTAASV
jgi:pimeloyl-ACP methyl ester carboxylesterase